MPASPDPRGARNDHAFRWSVERRLAFIRGRLIWEGRINRGELVRRFGISPNQATADLRRFEASFPGALVYDTRAKTYRPGARLTAADGAETHDLLRELRLIAEGMIPAAEGTLASPPHPEIAEAPSRLVDSATLVVVLAAVRERKRIEALYQSFSSLKPRRRCLEPHALVFDGFRWHVRARDAGKDRFRDFVLGRLADVRLDSAAEVPASADTDWFELVEIVVAPHPELHPAQRRAVEIDYGMERGRLRIRCRRAVAFYLRRRLGLLPGHERLAPADQQIVLVGEPTVSEPGLPAAHRQSG